MRKTAAALEFEAEELEWSLKRLRDALRIVQLERAALLKGIKKEGAETIKDRVLFLVNITKDGTKLDRIYKQDLAFIKAASRVTIRKGFNSDEVLVDGKVVLTRDSWRRKNRRPAF